MYEAKDINNKLAKVISQVSEILLVITVMYVIFKNMEVDEDPLDKSSLKLDSHMSDYQVSDNGP